MNSYFHTLLTLLLVITFAYSNAQTVEVVGKLKITNMEKKNATDSVVVMLPDGTLAIRDVSSLPDSTGSWTEVVDTTSTMKFVGIRTTSPSEALEVNGAIKIGNNIDDSPEKGTVRWNTTLKGFEGYTGNQWKSFSENENIFGRLSYNSKESSKHTTLDAGADDQFGTDVSISGDYAVAGAHLDDDGGSNSGSAYIYARSGTDWVEQAKLTASDAANADVFGWTVSISENSSIIGAMNNNSVGSAYIFD